MRPRQRLSTPSTTRSASVQRSVYSVGPLATVLTVGVVVLLLSGVFLVEWLRAPEFTLSSSSDLLSPNNDRELDTINASYTLADDAYVTARLFTMGGGLVRVLLSEEPQGTGQHNLLWDGRSETGAVVEDGQYRLEVYAAGVLRGTTRNLLLQVDTQPPRLQLANLNDRSRVGTETINVEGVTDADAVVWLVGEAQPLAIDATGRFLFQRKLSEGSNLIELRAVDRAGNTAVVQRQVELVTASPDITLLSPGEDSWTNQSITVIKGTAEPGVSVTVNDQPVTLNETGGFEHQVLLNEGENRLQVQATNDVGNVTTMERVIYLKTSPPEVSLNVTEGATLSDSLLQLSGHTEAGVTVNVNGRVIPVSTLGDFQASVFLVEGDNLIKITALDQAGNLTTLNRRVRLGPAGPADGLTRLWRNLSAVPSLAIPVLAAAALLLAFFFLRQNQVSLYLSVDQNAFTPGLPGEDRVLELALDLNKPARVTLEVLDQDGNVMSTLLRNRRRTARIHLFRWDGYDDYGRVLPPGDYTIQAVAGTPPVKVISAVQVRIRQDDFVHGQVGRNQVGHGQLGRGSTGQLSQRAQRMRRD